MKLNSDVFASNLEEFLNTNLKDILVGSFLRKEQITEKGGGELVGQIDFQANDLLRKFLEKELPDYIIISEETKSEWPPTEENFCLVDERDGTHNGMLGLPTLGTMLTIFENCKPVFSSFYLPVFAALGQRGFFTAVSGKGSFAHLPQEKVRLTVSNQTNLAKTFLLLEGTSKEIVRKHNLVFRLLSETRRMRNGLSSVFSFTRLASGNILSTTADILISFHNKPTDNLHGCLLIEEAGGKVTDFDGNPWSLENCSDLIFSNSLIHEQILKIVKEVNNSEKIRND